MKNPLKIGLCLSHTKTEFAPLLFSGDLTKGLERAKRYGYDGVELNLVDAEGIDQEWLIEKLGDLHLEVFAIATGQTYTRDGYSLYSPEQESRKTALERLRNHVDLASRLGCMVIIGGIRGRLIGPVGEWRRLRKKGNEALASCVAYAEERGVTLLLEPINRYETNVMNTVEEGIALIAELGSEKVKLLLDTFHMNIEERSVAESIIMAGSRLEYVHFSDSNRLAPGWGHVDFSEILSILKEIHYNGPIGVEVLPSPDDDRASKQALDYIRALV